jgi:hypothetical protein
MQATTNGSSWKGPLRGWRFLMAWGVLVGGLTALTRVVLYLTTEKIYTTAAVSPWLLSLGITLAILILLAVLVRCLSSWRNFKRLVLSLVCLVSLIALVYAVENIRGKWAWQRFQAEWAAKGEKFDFAALTPPPVPDDQNFALTPVVASTYSHILDRNGRQISPPNTNIVNRLQMPLDLGKDVPSDVMGNWQKGQSSRLEGWQAYYRNLALTTNYFPTAPQPQTPAADVLLALSKYDAPLDELRQAAALPSSRFPLNYEHEPTFAILLPHLAPMKGCSQVLRLRALAKLEAGQSDQALADISLALRLTQKIQSEPFLISHLVRIAMLHITIQPIWEGLAKHHWNEAQLLELERQLGTFDFISDYRSAMRGENACQIAAVNYLRSHRDKLETIGDFPEGESDSLNGCIAYLIPAGWFYQNELRISKFILGQSLPVADASRQTISPALVRQAQKSLEAMPRSPYTILCRMLLPALGQCSRKFASAQATVNLARTACALERHRLAQGKLPDSLNALVPRFIAALPRDPIGGQPLHYEVVDGSQFVLYSVGWNENDDGGQVGLSQQGGVDPEKGDWVWSY